MDPLLAGVVITGTVTIIGALVTGAVTIIGAIQKTQKSVENVTEKVHEVNELQSDKLDRVTEIQNEKLDTITILVDGRYSDVLDRVATLQEMVASLTGKDADKALATRARSDASAQDEQVTKSGVKEQRARSLLANQPKQLNELSQPPDKEKTNES